MGGSMMFADLKKRCMDAGLVQFGNKKDLVIRLVEHGVKNELGSMTMSDLKKRCKDVGLVQAGTREDLITRLVEYSKKDSIASDIKADAAENDEQVEKDVQEPVWKNRHAQLEKRRDTMKMNVEDLPVDSSPQTPKRKLNGTGISIRTV